MPKNWLEQSIKAGIFIALGCILYILAPNSVIGACLFSLGLLSVRLTHAYLYTGQVHQLIEGQRHWQQLILIWIANLIGVVFVVSIVLLLNNINSITIRATVIGINKLHMSYYELFIRSICCGILMTIATRKDTPLWVTSGCVIAFILAGFNHCIADAFYFFITNESIWIQLPALIIITVGNTIGGLLPVIGIP